MPCPGSILFFKELMHLCPSPKELFHISGCKQSHRYYISFLPPIQMSNQRLGSSCSPPVRCLLTLLSSSTLITSFALHPALCPTKTTLLTKKVWSMLNGPTMQLVALGYRSSVTQKVTWDKHTYMHTYMQTYTHSSFHPCIYKYIQDYMPAYLNAHTNTNSIISSSSS